MNTTKWALVASPTPPAQEAAEKLKPIIDWVPVEEADQAVVLGGDGFMLQTLHQMLNRRNIMPVYGMNLGTVGFLMNNWHLDDLSERITNARAFKVKPLKMEVETISGASFTLPAINEVSLLRETRQTAKLEIEINGRIMMEEL
ncbi:NAD(+)/NADH kinase, partial [Parasphingorhabdus sp.]